MASLALSSGRSPLPSPPTSSPSPSPTISTKSMPAWVLAPLIQPDNMSSFYDVIRRCNKFEEDSAGAMWEFTILDNSVPVGYMLPEHANLMKWENTSFTISEKDRKIHLNPTIRFGDDVVEICRQEFESLCEKNADNFNGCFKKWLNTKSDYHPIRGLDAKLAGLVIASPARGIFGIVTTGVHMNMYTVINGEIHVWVSKRSQNVTYAGKLDQLVAGAMDPADQMDPVMTLKREAREEAGLVIDPITKIVTVGGQRVGKVTAQTQITFYDQKDHIAGSEEGHVEPGIRYTFDLEVEPDFTPHPEEPESIDSFQRKHVNEVKEDLKNAQWKPNCGLVMLDFLLRKGEIQQGDDQHFGILKTGLQRELPFNNI